MLSSIEYAKKIIDKKHKPNGYNVGININESAGQTVGHVSIHLIPRYNGDVRDPVGGVRNVIFKKANYLKHKEKWGLNSLSNFKAIQPKSDKDRMKAFCAYLNELIFHNSNFIDVIMQCIDDNNNIVPVQHKSIYEAFLAGEEIAISLSCSLEENGDGKHLFVDNQWRIHKKIDYTPTTHEYYSLIPFEQKTMVLTIQNKYKIKRFGIVERTTHGTSIFIEHPLYKEVTDAMEEMVESF